jgi:DNA polymerase type B, organellar and viral
MCATGTFLNQWIYVPELIKYLELTNNKIRIVEDSIKEGYLFESKDLFTSYVEPLFKLKNSVPKTDPRYRIAKLMLNSLYGRFGLKQIMQIYQFINNFELHNFTVGKDIIDIIDLIGTNKSVVITEKGIEVDLTLESCVPIAAAVTAYARMYMAPLLLDKDLDIFYTDTDSFKTKDKITELERYQYLNHNGLGGLKYEETMLESIYLSPKVYGGILEDGKSLIKIKGFKDRVEFNILKKLLFSRKSIILNQDKWYKNWMKSEIKIKMEEYTLELNENKRINDFENLITKPHHFDHYDPDIQNK